MSPSVADEPLLSGTASPSRPMPWSTGTRALFRIAFVYFLLFCFSYGNGTIFGQYPFIGDWIEKVLGWPMEHLADWTSVHLLHFSGVGAMHHGTGSGDTLVQWVQEGLMVLIAVLGGLGWSAVAALRGHRRVEYTTLYAWLRFLVRLTCGMFMLTYGLVKVFPLQMQPISTAVLNEPVGNMSPMTMLWSLIALNPVYEMVCGAAEVIGGVLILFRRTALAGALLSAFVMSNVLLYNMFFDVPVKLFAANLLLALVFIVLPDMPALFRFFWLHQPAAPVGVWVPPASRRRFRIATRVTEVIFVVTFLVWMPIQMAMGWHGYRKANAEISPIRGGWHVDIPTAALASPEQQPITELYVDTPTLVRARSKDGALWRTSLKANGKDHTGEIGVYTSGTHGNFNWSMPDPNHLRMIAVPPKDLKSDQAKTFMPYNISLTRIPQPQHYPLLDRGLHLVNEWGLER